MTPSRDHFSPFVSRMRERGLPEVFIDIFAHYYEQLLQGRTGLIPESEILPVAGLADADTLPDRLVEVGERALARTAVVKLNGGLGTSMGLERAKSLLKVKQGLSFLDITIRQVLASDVPLILMNSFITHEDCLTAMKAYSNLRQDLPLAFLQHRQPKIRRSDLLPAVWPLEPELEWCPPGHGDIYAAMVTSGTLDALIEAGYEFAFVSNSDNLGAVIDRRILGYFASNLFPFMMEVADRTEMDRKGGHLALHADGQLILRELAQTSAEDYEAFQDISRHKYFNTNNLWLNLPALRQLMTARNNMLGLPMIRNAKTVDPRNFASTPVYQLETAMGSAIAVFEGAQAVRVPRGRFAPVKKTDDLLAVRSNAFVLTEDFHIVPNPDRQLGPPLVRLDSNHYRFVADLDERFPCGVPSLTECASFELTGDFVFSRDIICRGNVRLRNESSEQVRIPDGTLLEGEYRY
jgi:UTP--glucose-1-phosphate uridylyltransferase